MMHMGGLLARIAEIERTAALREKRDPLPGTPLPQGEVQFPLWPEPVRAVPNAFLRSAMFGVIAKQKGKKKGERPYLEREPLAALDGLHILYTGQRLDQGDLNAYQSVLHAVRLQAIGTQCRVTSYALLKLLGNTDTGPNRARLRGHLTRLRANAVEIKQGRYTYIGGLLDEAFTDEETKIWVIVLNPRLQALFAPDQFTQIEWAVRRTLGDHPLALWLHGFYASHAKPYPMKVETLHRLCGSTATVMNDFAKTLRKALDAVARASEAHGEGFHYAIRGDLVHVEKRAQGAQRRHLAKKVTRSRRSGA